VCLYMYVFMYVCRYIPTYVKVKVKFALAGHEGPEGEQRYSSTLSSTSALDRVGGQRHVQASLPPGNTRYAL
jgi:hypothetical protein